MLIVQCRHSQKNLRVGVGLLAMLTRLIVIRIPNPIYKDDIRGAFAWLETVRQPDEPAYAIYPTWRTAKYYGYSTLPFPALLPTDRRVWIVLDRQPAHLQVNLFVNHVVYPFIGRFGIYVMCIPTDTTPCPSR